MKKSILLCIAMALILTTAAIAKVIYIPRDKDPAIIYVKHEIVTGGSVLWPGTTDKVLWPGTTDKVLWP